MPTRPSKRQMEQKRESHRENRQELILGKNGWFRQKNQAKQSTHEANETEFTSTAGKDIHTANGI